MICRDTNYTGTIIVLVFLLVKEEPGWINIQDTPNEEEGGGGGLVGLVT